MTNRWSVLALLFAARTVMAFQFQTVAALSPFIREDYGVGLAAVGLLFGLYMAPGVFLALPGGGLAARFGEKRIVIVGLWMMAAGFALMALVPTWPAALAGRLIAGTGGLLMNVIMTKMVTDWFEGREIATAMSIFIVSWPAGIALALVVLPPVGAAVGLGAAIWVGAALALAGAIGFRLYPERERAATASAGLRMSRRTLTAAIATGATWGFVNAALAVVFGFGVALLVSRAVEVGAAGQVTSLTMVALAVVAPFGGAIADRTGRYMPLISVSVLVMAACLAAIVMGMSGFWLFILFGLACGMCAGPIMSLPGLYLPAGERAGGMGVFFTVYYLAFLIAPSLAGWVAETTATVEMAFVVGIAFCGLTLAALAATRVVGQPIGKSLK